MAEEQVSYASVILKTNKHSPPEAKMEDNEMNVRSKTTKKTADTNDKKEDSVYEEMKTADTNRLSPDKKTNSRGRCYQQVACCLGILCVILLLGIIAVCIYDYKKITDLTAENQNLTSQNKKLETQRNNLTEQIQNMEKKLNEFNVSQAQWRIDEYCSKTNHNSRCYACLGGWILFQSSCYAINDPDVSGQKTWEEARENCRGKISDLVVIDDETEKTFIKANSWDSSGTTGYWIGLRAEDGKWKWLNGSVLTENSWIQQPATNGQCVISFQTEGWKSVSCGARNKWICKKKALSL
ncbi:CD209 antigen-like protein A isoform X2 [Micropterus salmoides]|uniref:CD209 antigen-like protein A isoform X2 n=1 Tax=Micropterus salmoides TaxID=27706 RepID=UPI0018EC85C7|nr:CD209 antigen-like protein A isoform X2 [Micropterus salmoides]